MPPIRLTDQEMTAVFVAATPIPVGRRDAFLQDVARFCAAVPWSAPARCIARSWQRSGRTSIRRSRPSGTSHHTAAASVRRLGASAVMRARRRL
jgi:hypothetical protein